MFWYHNMSLLLFNVKDGFNFAANSLTFALTYPCYKDQAKLVLMGYWYLHYYLKLSHPVYLSYKKGDKVVPHFVYQNIKANKYYAYSRCH